MSLKMQGDLRFSAGDGVTPEKPIFLGHHSQDQFEQILSAYNALYVVETSASDLADLI